MYKQVLAAELKRFLDYIHKSRLYTGIPAWGYKPEDLAKFPPGTPGIGPYSDCEDLEIQFIEAFIQWAETDRIVSTSLVSEQSVKIRINTLHSLMLEPDINKYESLFIGQIYRGIDLLLALQVKKNWKTIYCTSLFDVYYDVLKGFFPEQNFDFNHIRLCIMSPQVLKENNILMILNNEGAHGIENYINDPKVTRIIKEGKVVDQTKHWNEHNWQGNFEGEFNDLHTRAKALNVSR